MIPMSKNDIATRLRDYAHIRYEMIINPNMSLKDALAKWITLLDGTKAKEDILTTYLNNDYFMSIYRTYLMYSTLKYFSLIEENNIDFILEDELDFDITKITSSKNISKKKLLLYLRNAFNHNDDPNHSKYNISPNGKYLEINLLDVRTPKEKADINSKPKPFNIKIDYNQLSDIVTSTMNASRGLVLQEWIVPDGFNLDKINERDLSKINTKIYYFKNKVDDDMQELKSYVSTNGASSDDKIKILSSNPYFVTEHYLYDEQVKMIIEQFDNCMKFYPSLKSDNVYKMKLFDRILRQTEPLPLWKTHVWQFQGNIHQLYMLEPNITQSFIDLQVSNLLADNDIKDRDPIFERLDNIRKERIKSVYLNSFQNKMDLIINLLDKTTQVFYPYMMYYGYMIDTIIQDEYVEINGINYNREKLRNSIVHGRYIISKDSIIHFYDRNNGYGKDHDFNEHYEISFNDLSSYIERKYIEIVKNQNPDTYTIKSM